MANTIREVLTAQGMRLPLYCGGMSFVGVRLSGTWTGVVTFQGSTDGINFNTISVTPFPSGTAVQTVTGNGNWFIPVKNYLVFQAVFTTLTTGTVVVTESASIDSSYQDAYLASTSIFVSQEVTGGLTNVITQPAQSNRAWRVKNVSVAFSAVAAAAVALTISDGASSVIWKGYVPLGAGAPAASGGGTWLAPLPAGTNVPGLSTGGLVCTPGNSAVITLAAPGGSVVSELNAEFSAA